MFVCGLYSLRLCAALMHHQIQVQNQDNLQTTLEEHHRLERSSVNVGSGVFSVPIDQACSAITLR